MSRKVLWFALALLALFVIISLALHAADKEEKKEERPSVSDGKLYVWGQPENGVQSLIVLNVLDGEKIEAAMLVPLIVYLPYKGDKATKEQLEEAIEGKLLPFELRGRDRFGRLVGDAYLGKEQGWATEYAPKLKLDKKDK